MGFRYRRIDCLFKKKRLNLRKINEIPRYSPFFIPKMISDMASGYISMKYGITGPNFNTVSACASAANGIIDSYLYIKSGVTDISITGGSEAAICESGIGGFNALRALSTRNNSPKTASRPFDQNRDGFVLGEGSGCIIIESLESAKKRDAKIYAEIAGVGMSSDAYHITAPHPGGIGAEQSIRNSLLIC